MRRAILGVIGIAIVLAVAAGALIRIPAVQDRIASRVIERAVRSTASDALFSDDALRVFLCGTSSPLPHPTRAKACVAVFAAGRFWVVDTGPGSWNNFALRRIPGQRVGAILLSHFHSDHIGELGEFDLQTWVAGRPDPLRVFGPQGVERVVAGFEAAYDLDAGYRIAHHGEDLLSEKAGRMQAHPFSVPRGGSLRILDEGGLTITAFEVGHAPVAPAVGYRFDFGGRSVVVSGDTVKHAGLTAAARDADVLVHEAQANHLVATLGSAAAGAGRQRIAKIMSDIPDYHTTPVEAAEVANEAGVGLLVFYHLTPPPPNRVVELMFLRGVDDVRADDWILADDGLLVELPVGSDAIDVRQLD